MEMAESNNLSCMLYGPGMARYVTRPEPTIQEPYDVLIRISYIGVCGSDVHFWNHGGVTRKVSEQAPLIMGHEASGIVQEVGSSVTAVQRGDRVAIEPGFPCRRCNKCKMGKYNLCPEMRFAADPPTTHGALCRTFKAPEDFVYKIPDNISLQEAVLVEPLSVAVHGVRLADLKPGQAVLVQGSGTVGLLAAAVARGYGAKKVFVTDINSKKLEFAQSFVDCQTFLSASAAKPEEEALRLEEAGGLKTGFDVVLECTGVESSAQLGLHALATGGTFIQIGMGKPNQSLPLGIMCEKEMTLKTAFRYGAGDYEIALGLLESCQVNVKPMISSIVPFESATEAWEKTKRGEGIKNLIEGVQDEQ